MKYNQLLIIGLFAVTALFSCKNEANEKAADTTQIEEKKEVEIKERKPLTKIQRDRASSVWTKINKNRDTKDFVRLMVSAGIADVLINSDSDVTVFAPSNDSFSVFTEKMNITNNPAQKEELALLLKNHIVKGKTTSADMVQAIKANKKVELTTLGGGKIKVTMDGDNIVIANDAGHKVALYKSDILASNGVIHIASGVLN